MDEHTLRLLAARRAACEDECAALGVALSPDAFVLSTAPDHSVPMRPGTVTQRYRRTTRRVGVRSTRLQSLRHYAATELIAAGVDLRTVAGRLGYGSGGATTLRQYAAWMAGADPRAAEVIGRIVPRPDPTKRQPWSSYERLVAELRSQVTDGTLAPGDPLPTLAELAATHRVSVGTAHHALTQLRTEGLVDVRRGCRATITR